MTDSEKSDTLKHLHLTRTCMYDIDIQLTLTMTMTSFFVKRVDVI